MKRIEVDIAEKQRANGTRVTTSASQRAATGLNVPDAWARKMEAITQAADDGDPIAIQGLIEINNRKTTPDVVRKRLNEQREEPDTAVARHVQIARELQQAIGFFDVSYAPRLKEPRDGFTVEARFVCKEECEAFIELLGKIPKEARNEFERASASWRK
jgi:hypothetical protein